MATIYVDKPARDGLRERIDKDSYISDPNLAYAVVEWMKSLEGIQQTRTILDPGAGTGVWGAACRRSWRELPEEKSLTIDGVELRRTVKPLGYNNWYPRTDFLEWDPAHSYDLILGNPPFKLGEAFIRKSLGMLSDNGWLCFLLPSDFSHGQGRARGLFEEYPPRYLVSLSERPQFRGPRGEDLGQANPNNYVLLIWRNYALQNKDSAWRTFSWRTIKK